MNKKNERRTAKSYFIDLGKNCKEISLLLDASEKTLGKWRKEDKWDELRAAKLANSNVRADNIIQIINSQAERRIELDQELRIAESQEDNERIAQIRGEIATIDDGVSKWNKTLESVVKENRIPISTHIAVVEMLFNHLRTHDEALFMKCIPFQESYINFPMPEGLKKKDNKKDEDPNKKKDQDPEDPDPEETKLSESFWTKFKSKLSEVFLSALNGKGLDQKVDELYSRYSCAECAGDMKFAEHDSFIDNLIITAFSGDLDTAKNLIFDRNYTRLSGAVDEVFGEMKFGDPDYLFAEKLRNSTAAFSSYKTMHQVRILSDGRYDSAGKLLTYDEYKSKIAGQLRAYNDRYLNTEHQAAITRTRIARQWRDMAGNTIMINARWLPSRAAHPREAHMPFYNKVWSLSDPFWGINFPGNVWGCMCGFEPTDDPTSDGKPEQIPASPGLDSNPGISAELFTKTHPYFKGLSRTYLKEAKRMAANNTWITTAGEGGFAVHTSAGHSKIEVKANRTLAGRLTGIDKADIDLLGINHTGISYDAFRRGRNQFWEFKVPTGSNIKNAIQNELKGSVKNRFVFELRPEHKIEEVRNALDLTFIVSKRSAHVQELEFLFPDNFLLRITREDLASSDALKKAVEAQMAAR